MLSGLLILFSRSAPTSSLKVLITLGIGIGVVGGVFLAGCGGGSHGGQTTDVQGIVLTYPETLAGTVTEADLTPAGAGVMIGVYALGRQGFLIPPYYQKHALPQTNANGCFTLKYEAHLQDAVYATDVCSDTPAVSDSDDGSGVTGYYTSHDPPSHGAYQQLDNAGILGDSIKAKYHVASVIVVSSRADACETPNIPLK